jgi:hypothetical protein
MEKPPHCETVVRVITKNMSDSRAKALGLGITLPDNVAEEVKKMLADP